MSEEESDALPCSCEIHRLHAYCEDDCACWGGIRSVQVSKSGRFATVCHRVLLRPGGQNPSAGVSVQTT